MHLSQWPRVEGARALKALRPRQQAAAGPRRATALWTWPAALRRFAVKCAQALLLRKRHSSRGYLCFLQRGARRALQQLRWPALQGRRAPLRRSSPLLLLRCSLRRAQDMAAQVPAALRYLEVAPTCKAHCLLRHYPGGSLVLPLLTHLRLLSALQ